MMIVECRDYAYHATQGRKIGYSRKEGFGNNKGRFESIRYGKCRCNFLSTSRNGTILLFRLGFALSRADANGLFIYTRGKEINVFKPKVSGKPVLTVTNGVDLIDFDGGLSGSEQYGKYEAVSWDPATQNQVRQTASAPTLNEQGDITIKNWQEMIVKYCKLMPLSTRTP